MEALEQVNKSTSWIWDDGSSILFWCWPRQIMKEFRDGCDIFIKVKLPSFTKNRRVPTYPAGFEMIKKKVYKVRSRRYISGVTVLRLTALFYVPKGEDDIRLVYCLTASGMNDAFWDPTFCMPLEDNVLEVATL